MKVSRRESLPRTYDNTAWGKSQLWTLTRPSEPQHRPGQHLLNQTWLASSQALQSWRCQKLHHSAVAKHVEEGEKLKIRQPKAPSPRLGPGSSSPTAEERSINFARGSAFWLHWTPQTNNGIKFVWRNTVSKGPSPPELNLRKTIASRPFG